MSVCAGERASDSVGSNLKQRPPQSAAVTRADNNQDYCPWSVREREIDHRRRPWKFVICECERARLSRSRRRAVLPEGTHRQPPLVASSCCAVF